MRMHKHFFIKITLAALLSTGIAAASMAQGTTTIVNPETQTPLILTTNPTLGETSVNPNTVIEITFNSEMDASTLNGTTLLLHATSADSMFVMHGERQDAHIQDARMQDDHRQEARREDAHITDRPAIRDAENRRHITTGTVSGTISYSNKVAVFTPSAELKEGTIYTFTVTNGVKSSDNVALESVHSWSFSTVAKSDSAYSEKQDTNFGLDRTGTMDRMERNENREGHTAATKKAEMNMIDLGSANQYVILAKTNINHKSNSNITGKTGEGSVGERMRRERDFTDSVRQRTSGQVIVWRSNQRDTTSTDDVSEAIDDMMSAYSDASMQNGDNYSTSHRNERFQSAALTPGVHEWNNSLEMVSDVTLSGSADDVWLFKVGDNLNVQENTVFTLTDGARAENIFWYVEGEVTIGKDAQFEGIILSKNKITLEKGAKLNGRMFSQSSITLDENTVSEPGSIRGRATSTNR